MASLLHNFFHFDVQELTYFVMSCSFVLLLCHLPLNYTHSLLCFLFIFLHYNIRSLIYLLLFFLHMVWGRGLLLFLPDGKLSKHIFFPTELEKQIYHILNSHILQDIILNSSCTSYQFIGSFGNYLPLKMSIAEASPSSQCLLNG